MHLSIIALVISGISLAVSAKALKKVEETTNIIRICDKLSNWLITESMERIAKRESQLSKCGSTGAKNQCDSTREITPNDISHLRKKAEESVISAFGGRKPSKQTE